jgi:hypothetical protein
VAEKKRKRAFTAAAAVWPSGFAYAAAEDKDVFLFCSVLD